MPTDMVKEDEKDEPVYCSFSDTYSHYDSMFNTELNVDRNMDQHEKKAFIMAYYLLDIDTKVLPHILEKQMTKVHQFESSFNYYSEISGLSYIDYLNLLKDQ